jgi:hypothetical protein
MPRPRDDPVGAQRPQQQAEEISRHHQTDHGRGNPGRAQPDADQGEQRAAGHAKQPESQQHGAQRPHDSIQRGVCAAVSCAAHDCTRLFNLLQPPMDMPPLTRMVWPVM